MQPSHTSLSGEFRREYPPGPSPLLTQRSGQFKKMKADPNNRFASAAGEGANGATDASAPATPVPATPKRKRVTAAATKGAVKKSKARAEDSADEEEA